MRTEIYINDILADLDEEETLTASYGNVSFGELKKRKGVKSNTYVFPFTQRNKTIYEGSEVQGSHSVKPYRKATFRTEIDGVIVFEGFCTLDEAKEGYEVQSFAGASDFYTIINNKKLTALDLSEWVHVWNETNIKQSWNRTEGFIYAFVEYGKEFSSGKVAPDYLLPQMFFHTIIKQIAIDAGYELYGDVLTNARFLKKLVIPNKFPTPIAYGGTWDLITLLDPTLTQSKLWLDFANCFGLQFDINELTHEIYANYIDDILFHEPEDWTTKVDNSEQPRTKYRFEEFGKNTVLKYKSESILVDNSAYQDFRKTVVVDDENLQEEGIIYESSFFMIQDVDPVLFPDGRATTRTFITKPGKLFSGVWDSTQSYIASEGGFVWYSGTYYKPIAPSLNQPPPINPSLWEAVAEKDMWEIKPRPMYGVLTTDVSSYIEIQFDTPVIITRIVNNHGMSWEDIYPLHYRVFSRIVNKTRRVESLIKLNYSDVNQMNFSRSKRIDNELYFLEEVKQFKINRKDSTYVELVRI